MTNAQLLESLIAFNTKNRDIEDAIRRLYKVYGSYNAVVEAESSDVAYLGVISAGSAELLGMIPAVARYAYRERTRRIRDLSNCFLAGEYLKMTYLGQHNEMMYVLALDDKGMLLKRDLVQEGTIDETSVYMRKIMECAIMTDASALIISHNHPGGTFDVSLADFQCTNQVSRLASDYGIALADHIIVADGKAHSMALMGEMPKPSRTPRESVRALLEGWVPDDVNNYE